MPILIGWSARETDNSMQLRSGSLTPLG